MRKNRRMLTSRLERGVISGWSLATAGGVTVSMMNRLVSNTGLHFKIAL